MTAYSVSFGLPDDESSAAARLAGDLGIRHREIMLTEEVVAESFDDWLADLDVPCANPTWVAVSHIARAVREDGGKVLLSGDGGDELLGGYSRWMTYLRFYERGVATRPGVDAASGGPAPRSRSRAAWPGTSRAGPATAASCSSAAARSTTTTSRLAWARSAERRSQALPPRIRWRSFDAGSTSGCPRGPTTWPGCRTRAQDPPGRGLPRPARQDGDGAFGGGPCAAARPDARRVGIPGSTVAQGSRASSRRR